MEWAALISWIVTAGGGLVVWVIYVVTDSDALAWIAFAGLGVVAALGFTMFAIWLRQRRATVAQVAATGPGGPPALPAEKHFTVDGVGLHGLLAVTTVVLVFLTAIGVGES